MSTKKIAQYGLFLSVALVLSYLETLLPVFVAVPGVKLGLANVVAILLLYEGGYRHALIFTCFRICLSAFLFSGFTGIFYGFAGGFLSVTVMALLKRTNFCSTFGVSMAGAVSHNLGQIIVACLVIENAQFLYYFPVLCISGLITGAVTGYLSFLLMRHLQ